jgi:hypothetical protein
LFKDDKKIYKKLRVTIGHISFFLTQSIEKSTQSFARFLKILISIQQLLPPLKHWSNKYVRSFLNVSYKGYNGFDVTVCPFEFCVSPLQEHCITSETLS